MNIQMNNRLTGDRVDMKGTRASVSPAIFKKIHDNFAAFMKAGIQGIDNSKPEVAKPMMAEPQEEKGVDKETDSKKAKKKSWRSQ